MANINGWRFYGKNNGTFLSRSGGGLRIKIQRAQRHILLCIIIFFALYSGWLLFYIF